MLTTDVLASSGQPTIVGFDGSTELPGSIVSCSRPDRARSGSGDRGYRRSDDTGPTTMGRGRWPVPSGPRVPLRGSRLDHYAPRPTSDQLDAIANGIGRTVRYARRIEGGLGRTTDVLELGEDGERVVLRRYWLPEPGEVDPSVSEFRALSLAAAAGVPVPEPL